MPFFFLVHMLYFHNLKWYININFYIIDLDMLSMIYDIFVAFTIYIRFLMIFWNNQMWQNRPNPWDSWTLSLNHKRNLVIEIEKVYNFYCKLLNFISIQTELELIKQFPILQFSVHCEVHELIFFFLIMKITVLLKILPGKCSTWWSYVKIIIFSILYKFMESAKVNSYSL